MRKRFIAISIMFSIMFFAWYFVNLSQESSSKQQTQKPQKTANIKGAQEYLKTVYGNDFSDLTLIGQAHYDATTKPVYFFNEETAFTKKVPANDSTCYLAYSSDDGLYFFVYHNSASAKYGDTLGEEKEKVEQFEEIIDNAKNVFGTRLAKTEFNFFLNNSTLFGSPQADIRQSYNKLIKDVKDPFEKSGYVKITPQMGVLKIRPYLNIQVNLSLDELRSTYRLQIENLFSSSHDICIYTIAGERIAAVGSFAGEPQKIFVDDFYTGTADF